MGNAIEQLQTERQTYEKHKDELLQSAEGKYVLITGDRVVGVYESKLDAVAIGHETLGAGPFLVKKVERMEKPVRILLPRG